MKIIIAGGRDFDDTQLMEEVIDRLHDEGKIDSYPEIVCGEARGADRLGRKIAEWQNWPIHSFPAEWDKYGKSAGYRRNVDMGNFADVAIIFWDGRSKGTKHMIDTMNNLNKPVFIQHY